MNKKNSVVDDATNETATALLSDGIILPTELTTTEKGGALAVFSAADLFADAGKGTLENVKLDDITIPRLAIIQASSDELKPKHAKYIAGAQIGQFANTLTQELFDGEQGIVIIPCHYTRDIREWSGKRIVNRHPVDTKFTGVHLSKKDGKGQWITVDGQQGPEEHQIVETAEFFVLHLRPNGEMRRATIPMKSTALKVAKKLNSFTNEVRESFDGKSFNPPSFGQVYLLTTVDETSIEGKDFKNYGFKYLKFVDNAAVYSEAKKYYDDARQGAVQVQEEETPEAPADTTTKNTIF